MGRRRYFVLPPPPYTTPQGWGALSSTSLSLVEGEVPRTPSPFEFPTPWFVKLLKVKENMNLFSFWHSVSVSVSDQANACLIFTHLLKLRPSVPADPTDPRWHWDWRDEHFGIGPFRSGIRSGPKETRLWRRGAHPFLQCPQRGNNGAGVMDHVVSVAPLPTLPLISPAIQKRTQLCSSRLTLWGHLAQCSACGWGIMGHLGTAGDGSGDDFSSCPGPQRITDFLSTHSDPLGFYHWLFVYEFPPSSHILWDAHIILWGNEFHVCSVLNKIRLIYLKPSSFKGAAYCSISQHGRLIHLHLMHILTRMVFFYKNVSLRNINEWGYCLIKPIRLVSG